MTHDWLVPATTHKAKIVATCIIKVLFSFNLSFYHSPLRRAQALSLLQV